MIESVENGENEFNDYSNWVELLNDYREKSL